MAHRPDPVNKWYHEQFGLPVWKVEVFLKTKTDVYYMDQRSTVIRSIMITWSKKPESIRLVEEGDTKIEVWEGAVLALRAQKIGGLKVLNSPIQLSPADHL